MNDIIALLLELEGPYSYDPKDQGAETCWGISRKYHPDWRGWPLVDELKPDKAAVAKSKNIKAAANEFYVRYWVGAPSGLMLSALPIPIARQLFILGVNAGWDDVTKVIQGVLGLPMDGVFGVNTSALWLREYKQLGEEQLCIAIIGRYIDKVANYPPNLWALRGWYNRAIRALKGE